MKTTSRSLLSILKQLLHLGRDRLQDRLFGALSEALQSEATSIESGMIFSCKLCTIVTLRQHCFVCVSDAAGVASREFVLDFFVVEKCADGVCQVYSLTYLPRRLCDSFPQSCVTCFQQALRCSNACSRMSCKLTRDAKLCGGRNVRDVTRVDSKVTVKSLRILTATHQNSIVRPTRLVAVSSFSPNLILLLQQHARKRHNRQSPKQHRSSLRATHMSNTSHARRPSRTRSFSTATIHTRTCTRSRRHTPTRSPTLPISRLTHHHIHPFTQTLAQLPPRLPTRHALCHTRLRHPTRSNIRALAARIQVPEGVIVGLTRVGDGACCFGALKVVGGCGLRAAGEGGAEGHHGWDGGGAGESGGGV